MFVEEYFDHLEKIIQSCGYIQSKTLTRDSRSDYNGSVLFVREFVCTKIEVEKDMYAYHYQNAQMQLIFRYDNTRHFPDLATFPHHKHLPAQVIPSEEMDLERVIQEIVTYIQL